MYKYSVARGLALAVVFAGIALAHGEDEESEDLSGMALLNATSESNMTDMAMGGMGMGMHMEPFNFTDFIINYNTTSFLNTVEDRGFLVAHISMMTLAFVFLLPASIMLSIAGNPLHTPIHVVFLSTVALGMIPATIYTARAPDLYPGNIHSSFGWIIVFLLGLHFFAGIAKTLLGWALTKAPVASSSVNTPYDTVATDDDLTAPGRNSHDTLYDSAGGSSSSTLDGYDESEEMDYLYSSEFGYRYTDANSDGRREYVLETGDADMLEKPRLQHHPLSVEYRVQHYIATRLQPLRNALARMPERLIASLYLASNIVYSLLNRPMLFVAFFQILTGVVTATGMGMGDKIYGLLAHFIKGSVFFWFGTLTFGRVLGAYANLGWAWNIRPPMSMIRRPSLGARFFTCSMEMVESGLIFFYGITNVFMEHLGNKDGKWSHKDLQHASIAFMYIGGGLCGLLYESRAVRGLFNAPLREKLPTTSSSSRSSHNHIGAVSPESVSEPASGPSMMRTLSDEPSSLSKPGQSADVVGASSSSRQSASAIVAPHRRADTRLAEPASSRFSFNPFPLFTIFFTGVLMSQHQQATQLSTSIHMQWGYLLSFGSVLRTGTYIIQYLNPPSSYLPSRPITEVLVSFCLIAGGGIFVASSQQIVEAMVYYNLDSMFTMNVAVGLSALYMAYIMILMALKGWATKRRFQ